ncbi:MAG: hypothetical protein M1831_006450 [Alyxoria varia]|nr:MAG: hypothetical protein M1831_006450 [Alyxoria varia]
MKACLSRNVIVAILLLLGHFTLLVDGGKFRDAFKKIDPRTYVFAKGDKIPRIGPGQSPGNPPEPDTPSEPRPRLQPASSIEENSLTREVDEDDDFPIWLDRSRELRELPEYPSERDLKYLMVQAKKWVESLDPSKKSLKSDAIDIRSGKFTLRIAFLNPLGGNWPQAYMFGKQIHPYNTPVRQEPYVIDPLEPVLLVHWMLARLRRAVAMPIPPLIDMDDFITEAPDPGVTEEKDSAGGQLLMLPKKTRAPFAFGYRLVYVKDRSWFPGFSRGTSPVAAVVNVEDLLEDAETTAFGSLVVDPKRIPDPPAPASGQKSREVWKVDMQQLNPLKFTVLDVSIITGMLTILLWIIIWTN